jgi:hypothetical protein
MNRIARKYAWLLLFLCMPFACLPAIAVPVQVHFDAKCPDGTIDHQITTSALAAIRASARHRVAPRDQAALLIEMSAAPVRVQGDDGAPRGIGLAVLARKKTADGHWDVTTFRSYFIPIDDIEDTIKQIMTEELR